MVDAGGAPYPKQYKRSLYARYPSLPGGKNTLSSKRDGRVGQGRVKGRVGAGVVGENRPCLLSP